MPTGSWSSRAGHLGFAHQLWGILVVAAAQPPRRWLRQQRKRRRRHLVFSLLLAGAVDDNEAAVIALDIAATAVDASVILLALSVPIRLPSALLSLIRAAVG